jgi:hypothetical protein
MGQSLHFDRAPLTSGLPRGADIVSPVRFVPIVLQKFQNAVRLNFRQRTKQAVIVDRCRFNRATEVVSEFVTE